MSRSTTTPSQYETDCPDCGETLDKRGLGSHRNSDQCLINQHQNIKEEENLAQISLVGASQTMVEYLEEHGYPCKELLTRTGKKHYHTTQEGRRAIQKNVLRNPQVNGKRAEIIRRIQDDYVFCNGTENSTLSRRYNKYDGLFIIENTQNIDLSRKRVIYAQTTAEEVTAFTSDGLRIGPAYSLDEAEQRVDAADIVSTLV